MPTLFLDTVCVHDTLIMSIKGVGIEGGYPSQLLEGGGVYPHPPLYRNSDKYRYSPFYVQGSLCPLIILVFELYP